MCFPCLGQLFFGHGTSKRVKLLSKIISFVFVMSYFLCQF